MAGSDIFITILVLVGVFFLGYSAIRHQGLLDTVKEIKEIIQGKADEIKEGATQLKYAN